MLTRLLKAKLHRATVTQTDLNYHGSITIDRDLLDATGLLPNEAVLVADCENGNRFETYVIAGARGTGIIGINGAAARLSRTGNRVIVMSFIYAAPDALAGHQSKTIICDDDNRVAETIVVPTVEQ